MSKSREAAMAAINAMDDFLEPLNDQQRIEAMEDIVDELESRIRCEQGKEG